MTDYIDAYVFPIPRDSLPAYRTLATEIATIWKEHGALSYREFVSDDLAMEGTRSIRDAADAHDGEAVVFGWIRFASRAARDRAHAKVAADPRVARLMEDSDAGFDATRMAFGGFTPLVD